MNNKLFSFLTAFAFSFLALAYPAAHAQAAPSLLFNPTSAVVVQNDTVTLTIGINVDANTVKTSDITIQYAANDLDFVSATNGNFFPFFDPAPDPAHNVLELHAYTTSPIGTTGNGTYATVVFKAKKTSGSSTVSFDCANTHIYSTDLQNVLSSCPSQTNMVALTYSDGSVPTPTPTVGAGTPTPTATPTPTSGGQGGTNTIPSCVTLSSDTSIGTGTPLTVRFTCSGMDPDGYINAAEFTFGDNTRDTIYKNAGSPGSISTTHTYTTIGTLGATCRVRDNNNVFSNATNDCKRIIVINPKPANTAATSYYQRVIAGEKGNVIPVVSPTPEEVAIVYETPTPPVIPTLAREPTKNPLENLIWWIVGIFVAILLAILLLRKKKSPPPPYIQPPAV